MGVLRNKQSFRTEMEEFREMLLQRCSRNARAAGRWKLGPDGGFRKRADGDGVSADGRMVCVTGAVSYVGFAVVNCLLDRGYCVRLIVENQEDLDKIREMEQGRRDRAWAVMANVMDLDSLCHAFDGCTAVFYTAAFIDPVGLSGYSKHMADIEVRAAERAIEACARTPSVIKCVFTSSLLACVWRQDDHSLHDRRRHPTVFDETCWSDETLCRDKKLWFALGKTMAEKAAWRAARGRDLKLVTVCPALVTVPSFRRRNATGSIAYLKGAQEMQARGLLATVDIAAVAEAHVCIYEAMGSTACGRYICYDHVIHRSEEAGELGRQLGLPNRRSMDHQNPADQASWFELSNRKLSRLMDTRRRCTLDCYSILYL